MNIKDIPDRKYEKIDENRWKISPSFGFFDTAFMFQKNLKKVQVTEISPATTALFHFNFFTWGIFHKYQNEYRHRFVLPLLILLKTHIIKIGEI